MLPQRQNFHADAVWVALNGTAAQQKELGISGYSPLLKLPKQSVHYCRAVPYVTMHMVAIRVVGELLSLWRGEHIFDQPDEENPDWEPAPYIVRDVWDTMGDELELARKKLPIGLGPTPLNIGSHYPTFKRRVSYNFIVTINETYDL